MELLSNEVEALTLDGTRATVLRAVREDQTEAVGASVVEGTVSRTARGCYGFSSHESDFSPVVWPAGSSITAEGDVLLDDGRVISPHQTVRGEGREALLPDAVEQLCGTNAGYELRVVLDVGA